MTKPVQTYHSAYPGSMWPDRPHENPAEGNTSYVTYADHVADKEAALLQVREKLIELAEKLRKDSWTGEGSEQYRMGRGHSANELEALAATLGNQGK